MKFIMSERRGGREYRAGNDGAVARAPSLVTHSARTVVSRALRQAVGRVGATVAITALVIVATAMLPVSEASGAVSHRESPSNAPHAIHPHTLRAATGSPTTPPFTECPAIGDDSACGLLIVITNNGDQILGDPAQGPYDGIEDTLIGVVNNSSKPLYRLQLSSSSQPIFGFDGDGICANATGGYNPEGVPTGWPGDSYCTASQLNGSDPGQPQGIDPNGSDYQGPDNTFSLISSNQQTGSVNFNTPLAPNGGSTYFSLEETLTSNQLSVQYGYWEVAADGGLFAYDAPFYGSMGGKPLNAPVVGIAEDPATGGYWEVASDGGLFAFNASFHGSMGGKPLNSPVVAMVATPDGGGYWEVASDGGLFAFGDAGFYGSMGGKPLNSPVVGITSTPDGKGYYEVASDGGLFAFGDAVFYGSMGGKPLNQPVVGMATDPATGGYWEVASDGGLFAFNAAFLGSMGGQPLNQPVVGMASTPDGGGYWEVASDGGIFSYGNALFWGSTGGMPLNAPVVGISASSA